MTLSHHHHHHLLLPVVLLLFLWWCSAEAADPSGVFCNEDSTFGSGKASANVDQLLVELVSKASANGFLATSYGSDKDVVYGLAQCRGDVVGRDDCSACVQDAAKQIRTRCPNQADARIWFEYCFLRYSDKDFIGKVDTGFGIYYYNVENVTDPEQFNRELGQLMEKIRSQAVDAKNAGLGKGQTKLTPFITLYALVQCTRDLSPLSCAQCLAISVGNFPNFCDNRKGCRVLYSSCYTRYELYPFFFPISSSSSQNFSNTHMLMVYP